MFALWTVAALSNEAAAQERLSTTRVYTEPTGLRFFVDGQPYRGNQAFIWPAGSKHTLSVDPEQFPFEGQRYKFTGWSDPGNTFSFTTESMVITADPTVTAVRAQFNAELLVRVLFNKCDASAPDICKPPGYVLVNNKQSTTDIEEWVTPESTVRLFASPNAGFVFAGWGPTANYATGPSLTIVAKVPLTFSSIFAAAKRVNLNTDPAGLLVAPDGTPTRSPAEMDWGEGTRHTLGAVSPQVEKDNSSRTWVFSHWSNGAKLNEIYQVKNSNVAETLTAKYVRGVTASFVTEPVGLKLRVEGRENWPAYNFVWGVGMKYQVSAPAEQTDSRGRRFVFKGWSNGGAAAQEVAILDQHVETGYRLVATYEALSRLSVETLPPGLPVLIDGQECRGACTFDKPAGTRIEIGAPPSISVSGTSRMEFMRWSDNGAQARTFTFGNEPTTTLVAAYKNLYRLEASSDPQPGANFRTDPDTGDGFFDANTSVAITAETKPGYRFRRWDGDLSGTFRSGRLEMSAPRAVRALLETVPWADENNVRNAAAAEDQAEPLVAPGSIALITGVNLSAETVTGPGNPLAQTLGGLIVRLNDRLLPLVSVTPGQVQFFVPSDLTDGQHWIYVRSGINNEMRLQLNVSRNAPGLYHTKSDTLSYATAAHENGSEIGADSPAARGERVTLYGTGFGPFDKPVLDGFAVPMGTPYNLVDSLELFAGDRRLELEWAGAQSGKAGSAIVRFRVPEDIEVSNGSVAVRVRVNGRDSNTVLLRVAE